MCMVLYVCCACVAVASLLQVDILTGNECKTTGYMVSSTFLGTLGPYSHMFSSILSSFCWLWPAFVGSHCCMLPINIMASALQLFGPHVCNCMYC